ncbi:MAG: hypothetical protein KAX65_02475, partial [Caldilineaceae bacterium]|nr:hypothetical protein [Caldilineaceae bacterium]
MAQANDAGLGGGKLTAAQRASNEALRKSLLDKANQYKPKRADIPDSGYNYTESNTASGKPATVRRQEIDNAQMAAQATQQRRPRPAPVAPPKPALTVAARPLQSQLASTGDDYEAQRMAVRNAAPPRPQPKPAEPVNPWGTAWENVLQGAAQGFGYREPEPTPDGQPAENKGILGATWDLFAQGQRATNPVWRAGEGALNNLGQIGEAWNAIPDEAKGAPGAVGQGAVQGAQALGAVMAKTPIVQGLAAGPWALNAAYDYFTPDKPAPSTSPSASSGQRSGNGAPAQPAPAPAPVAEPVEAQPGDYYRREPDQPGLANQEAPQLTAPAWQQAGQAFDQWWAKQPYRDYFEDTAKGAQEILAPYMNDELASVLGKGWGTFVTSVKGVTTTKIGDMAGMAPSSPASGMLSYMGQVANAMGAGDITVGQAIGAYGAPLTAALSQEFGQGTSDRYKTQNLPANATPLQVSQAALSQVPQQVIKEFVDWDAFNRAYTNTPGDNLMQVLAESGYGAAEQGRKDLAYKTVGADLDLTKANAIYQESEALLDLADNPAVPAAERQAARARSAILAQEAVDLFNKATEGKNQSYGDIFNKNADIRAELFTGILLDPWNLLDFPADAITESIRAARMAGWTINAGQAAKNLDVTSKAGAKLAEAARQGLVLTQKEMRAAGIPIEGASGRNWFDQFFGRTGDTQAHMDASAATSLFSQLAKGVDNVADARRLVDVVIDTPQELLTGVKGLIGEYYQHIGAPRFGPTLVANENAQRVYMLAQTVAEKLRGMKSLADDVPFNLTEFIAEVDATFYRAARQVRGLTAVDELPLGAVDMKVVPASTSSATGAAPGTAEARFVVAFVDKDGAQLATSLPMNQRAADEYVKAVKGAVEAGKADPINNVIRKSVGIQRALLADMWLNLRPGHWIRNAAAAMTATMADDLMTFDSMTKIMDDAAEKFGGVAPNERVFSATSGKGRGLTGSDMTDDRHWANDLKKGIPIWDQTVGGYASANEFGQKMWTGLTHVLGTNIPFGEQAFYTRAWYKGFQRAFASAWDDVIYQQFGQRMREMQIPKPLRDSILNRLRSTGITGSKADVARAAREAIMGASMVFDMRALKIADETITPQGWKELDGVLQAYARGDRFQTGLQGEQRAIADIKRIIAAEKTRYQDMLRNGGDLETPAVAERVESTAEDMAQRAGAIIDDLTQAAKEIGIPEDEAKVIAQQKAQQVIGAEAEGWNKVIDELAAPTAAPDAAPDTGGMIVATDLMAELYDLRREAQIEVDQLSKAASTASPATRKSAWNIKWFRTQEIYDELAVNQQAAFDRALTRLRQMAAGEPVAPEYDWWKAINRYTDWEDEKLVEARALEVGSTRTTAPDVWDKVIGANRQYLDSSYVILYAAFRKFPDLDGLDIIRSTQHDIDRIGAQVAATLKPKRDKLWALTEAKKVKKGQWDAYFALRNRLWNKAFDNQYRANLGATQAIVLNGLAKDVPSTLRWAEDFGGRYLDEAKEIWQPAEYMVLGLQPDGLWRVRDMQTGDIMQLAGEGPPTLPRLRALLMEWMTPTPKAKGRGPIEPLDQGIGVQVNRILDAQAAGQPLPDDLPPAVVDVYRELIARAEGEQAWSVPKNVMDDYYTVTNNYHRQVAQTMKEFQARYGKAPDRTAAEILDSIGLTPDDLTETQAAALRAVQEQEARQAYLDAAIQQAEQAPAPVADDLQAAAPAPEAAPQPAPSGSLTLAPPQAATPPAGVVAPVTPPTPAQAFASAPSAETFRPLMQRAFNLTDQQAGDVDRLAAARARIWAKQTGRDAGEWYGAHFADIVTGGEVDPEALYQQMVQTPEFRQWFDGSKVVDETGAPKRVYHATTADFEAFDRAFAGKNTGHATT